MEPSIFLLEQTRGNETAQRVRVLVLVLPSGRRVSISKVRAPGRELDRRSRNIHEGSKTFRYNGTPEAVRTGSGFALGHTDLCSYSPRCQAMGMNTRVRT